MRFRKSGLLAFIAISAIACKEVNTTPSPGSTPQDSNSGDAKVASPQVGAVSDVGLDQIPQLTVDIEIGNCVGNGRWYDYQNSTVKLGAVSVTPTRTTTSDNGQPAPWVFDPAVNKAGETVEIKSANKWRIERGEYSVEAIAYDVMDPKAEAKLSKITKTINFQTSNEVKLEAVGTWVSSKCNLAWK